jgi:hypothetical protein
MLVVSVNLTREFKEKMARSLRDLISHLREQLKARSLDDAIKSLIKEHRLQVLQAALGADRGKITTFTEDRGEDQ